MEKNGGFSREGYLTENYHFFHLRDTAGQERDFHFHDFDKLVVLIAGRVDYAVEDKTYALRPWELLLIPHHTIHKALIDKKEPYERIILYLNRHYFDALMPDAHLTDCFDRAGRSGEHLLLPDEKQRESLRDTLHTYEAERSSTEFGAEAMADALMIRLLIGINRVSAAAPGGNLRPRDAKIEAALSYINEHLAEDLSVELLAEKVYLSRFHFMRLFKENTGSTVHAYIRQKRLLYAAKLIRSGTNANKAAADSGFSDYSAFHRAFRECFSVNPGELKK